MSAMGLDLFAMNQLDHMGSGPGAMMDHESMHADGQHMHGMMGQPPMDVQGGMMGQGATSGISDWEWLTMSL